MTLTDLPIEVLEHIAADVNHKLDLVSLISTCSLMQNVGEALLVLREVHLDSLERSSTFFSFLIAHPLRAKSLRVLGLFDWIYPDVDMQSERTLQAAQGELGGQAAIALVLAGGLQSLTLSRAAEAFKLHQALPLAISQCRDLEKLHIWDLLDDFYKIHNFSLRCLCHIQAPIKDIFLESYGDHVFEILANFRSTLRSVSLSYGKIPQRRNRDLPWPHVHSVTLELTLDLHTNTLESAFPNVEALRVTYDGSPSDVYEAHERNKRHRAQHWKQLKSVTGDQAGLYGIALHGCNIQRLHIEDKVEDDEGPSRFLDILRLSSLACFVSHSTRGLLVIF